MTEYQPAGVLLDVNQASLFRRRQVVDFPLPGRRGLQRGQVSAALQGGEQEKVAGGGGQAGGPGGEQSLKPTAEREDGRQGRQRAALLGVQGQRQLQQGEGVALGLGQDAPTHNRSELGKPGADQVGRRRAVQRPDLVAGEAAAVEEGFRSGPGRRQETYPGAAQAADDEAEDQGAGAVQPRQVVDNHQQRPGHGRLAQQG